MSKPLLHDYFPPESFGRSVQDTLGDDVMRKLREKLGGRSYRFPKGGRALLDNHPLVKAVGRRIAEQLCHFFGDETTYIPKPPPENPYPALMAAGMSVAEMARHLGLSDRHVRRQMRAHGIPPQKPARRPLKAFKTAQGAADAREQARRAILTGG